MTSNETASFNGHSFSDVSPQLAQQIARYNSLHSSSSAFMTLPGPTHQLPTISPQFAFPNSTDMNPGNQNTYVNTPTAHFTAKAAAYIDLISLTGRSGKKSIETVGPIELKTSDSLPEIIEAIASHLQCHSTAIDRTSLTFRTSIPKSCKPLPFGTDIGHAQLKEAMKSLKQGNRIVIGVHRPKVLAKRGAEDGHDDSGPAKKVSVKFMSLTTFASLSTVKAVNGCSQEGGGTVGEVSEG